MKWINGHEKQWNCIHVNKCWVLLDYNGELIDYCTDYPEPEGLYRYVFAKDVFPEYASRPYTPCDCKKDVNIDFDCCTRVQRLKDCIYYSSDHKGHSYCDIDLLQEIIKEYDTQCSNHKQRRR